MTSRVPRRKTRQTAHLDHVVLETRDPAASVRFYERVLAFPAVRLAEFLAGKVLFPSVRVNAHTVIDLFPPKMWVSSERRNPNHFCVALDEAGVRKVKGRLARLGIRITQRSNHNFGARGFARSIYFSDPDGTNVEVRSYPEKPKRS